MKKPKQTNTSSPKEKTCQKHPPQKRKLLPSNLSLFILVSHFLHCCTDLPPSLPSKQLQRKHSLKSNQNHLCIKWKPWTTWILELKCSWQWNQNENNFTLLQWWESIGRNKIPKCQSHLIHRHSASVYREQKQLAATQLHFGCWVARHSIVRPLFAFSRELLLAKKIEKQTNKNFLKTKQSQTNKKQPQKPNHHQKDYKQKPQNQNKPTNLLDWKTFSSSQKLHSFKRNQTES